MSKETKFTLGPWGWRAYAHSDADLAEMKRLGMEPVRMLTNEGQVALMSYADPDEPKRVALVDCRTSFKRGTGHKTECAERDANARLMAAAPEMFDALKPRELRQVSILLIAAGMDDAAHALDKIADAQDAAISKATLTGK